MLMNKLVQSLLPLREERRVQVGRDGGCGAIRATCVRLKERVLKDDGGLDRNECDAVCLSSGVDDGLSALEFSCLANWLSDCLAD